MKNAVNFFVVFGFLFIVGVSPSLATMDWRPAEVAMQRIDEISGEGMDESSLSVGLFEDIRAKIKESAQIMISELQECPPSELSSMAWEALKERDITGVEAATFRCLEMYGEEARRLQMEFEADDNKYLTALMTRGKTTMKPLVFVGEALLALGEAYYQEGKDEEAMAVYRELVRHYYLCASDRR